jgi:hypothetical protein
VTTAFATSGPVATAVTDIVTVVPTTTSTTATTQHPASIGDDDPLKISVMEVPRTISEGQSKWFGGVVISDTMYGVPCNANVVLIYNPVMNRFTSSATIPTNIDIGDSMWYGGVVIRNVMYGFPGEANVVLIYNPATDAISSSALIPDTIDLGDKQWSGGAVVLDVMYGCPYSANNVLIYTPGQGSKSEQISASAVIPSTMDDGNEQWAGGVVVDEILYCTPVNAKGILIYNPSLGTFSSAATADGGHPKTAYVSAAFLPLILA